MVRAEMETWFKERHSLWRRGSIPGADSVVCPLGVLRENFDGEASDYDIMLSASRLERAGDWVPNVLGGTSKPTVKPSSQSPIMDGVYLDRADMLLRDSSIELVIGDEEELAARERVIGAATDLLRALDEYAEKKPVIGHNGPPEAIDVRNLTASSIQCIRDAASITRSRLNSGHFEPLKIVIETRAARDAVGSLRAGPDLMRRTGEKFLDSYASKLGELAAYGTIAALASLHPMVQHFIHMVVLWLLTMMPQLSEH